MYKCIALILIYASVFIIGFIEAEGRDHLFNHTAMKDLCCIGTWTGKPVWTLTYDATRDIVLLGSCGCICVLDISDPSHPEKITEFTHSQCNTCGLFYQSETHLLFICDGVSGLKIWNLRDPGKPAQVGTINTPGYASAVHVVGRHAYIADGDGGLRIIDVSDPADPHEIGHITMTTACHVYVEDRYAYVADLGLRIIDIANPEKPEEIAFLATAGVAYGVQVIGNTAYIADDWYGLCIIDVSDPTNPYEIARLKTPGYAWGVQVRGSTAYVSAYDGGLRIIDVSNPATPQEIAFHETPDKALQAVIADSYVYLAAAGKGLLVYGMKK